jgi:hypothetical protein
MNTPIDIVRFNFIDELNDWFTDNSLNLVYNATATGGDLQRILAIFIEPNGNYVAFIDTTAQWGG